jgi:TatD DNase family protein
MILTDTHTHLYLEEFKNDIDETIVRAVNAGIRYFIIPNIDHSTVEPMLRLCSKYREYCFPAIGLHPGSVKENYLHELALLESCINKEKYVAIGEIGIDLYWDKTFIKEQTEAFKIQLSLAQKNNLPVIIHSRNSINEIIHIINDEQYQGIQGVFHCYSGNLQQALMLIEKGFMIGIGGVLTYKNSGLVKIVREIPLQSILLETDSPYLPPVPYRGQRNESAYIFEIAAFIAQIKGCSLEEVASVTTKNAEEVFKIG